MDVCAEEANMEDNSVAHDEDKDHEMSSSSSSKSDFSSIVLVLEGQEEEANNKKEDDHHPQVNHHPQQEAAVQKECTAVRNEMMDLFQRQAKTIAYWRAMVFGCLTVVAVLVSICVYLNVRTYETKEFESHFQANALRLVESFQTAAQQKMAAISAMSTTITSFALETNATFPFVTIPNFVERGSDLRIQADALVVHYCPLVQDDVREEWEQYALEHRGHIDKAYYKDKQWRRVQDATFSTTSEEVVQVDGSSHVDDENYENESEKMLEGNQKDFKNINITTLPFVLDDNTGYHPRIFPGSGDATLTQQPEPEQSGPYLPFWQRSPINRQRQTTLNLNYAGMPIFQGIIPAIQRTGKAVISKAAFPQLGTKAALNSIGLLSQYRHDFSIFAAEPTSLMAVPVFDSFEEKKTMVGVVASSLYWRQYFYNVLSSQAIGYICVLKNSVNQTLVYRVDGGDVHFVGKNDIHDPTYNDMAVSININSYVEEQSNPQTRSYTTVSLNQDFVVWELLVYPSHDTENTFTGNAWNSALVVASIFALTMLSFFLFDRLVERRQNILMDQQVTTKSSSNILVSLFPKQPHSSRFFQQPMDGTTSWNKSYHSGSSSDDDNHSRRDHCQNKFPDDIASFASLSSHEKNTTAYYKTSISQNKVERLVDSFPETTILFADIVGFTSWSASRMPDEVFALLETLYGAFDTLALQHKVLKVETIGDSYLAATGLPQRQKDHALIMTRFAHDCLHKTSQILEDMTGLLSSSQQLNIRIGLHSGPVTAGIMPPRSRDAGHHHPSCFQICGDTVDMASFLERTGTPGKIHISETTANELIRHGRSKWLTRREDMIVPKDEGDSMKTYWVSPSYSRRSLPGGKSLRGWVKMWTMSKSEISVLSDGGSSGVDVDSGRIIKTPPPRRSTVHRHHTGSSHSFPEFYDEDTESLDEILV